jgi:Zn finger protein HypA/HybF involved in hydrogenase expression
MSPPTRLPSMHEMGVALEICRIAEAHVGTDAARLLTSVTVIVGDDAGVEPSSLEFCLETLFAQPPFAGAAVHLTRVPGDTLRVDYLEVDDGCPCH